MLLVDVDKLKDAFCMTHNIIDDEPTIEAEPVRYGQWVGGMRQVGFVAYRYYMHCSLYGHEEPGLPEYGSRYCANCGAKMDGKEEESDA